MDGINIRDLRKDPWKDYEGIPCGKCKNFVMDDILHNMGHCKINRMDCFAEEMCEKCTFAKRR